jgi:hypothetical protein
MSISREYPELTPTPEENEEEQNKQKEQYMEMVEDQEFRWGEKV